MIAALRDEVATAERRLEEEQSSHADARRRFVAREAELEANASEGAAALTGMQRALEERSRRAAAAEECAAALEAETAALAGSLSALQEQAAHRWASFPFINWGRSAEAPTKLQALPEATTV